jgi:M6 family metalloprotease-like protein
MAKKYTAISLFIFVFSLISSEVLSAPPFPGVWEKTRLGFKSQKDVMRISPESLLTPQRIIEKPEGELNCVAILAEFQDKTFNTPQTDPKTYFSELLFGSISQNKYYTFPTFRDFYLINSYGKLKVRGQVFGPYKLSFKLSDYGCGFKNASSSYYCGFGQGVDNLAKDLIQLSDKDIDFSQFDSDNDGDIDCFIIIHAGQGGETQEYSLNNQNCCDIWSRYFYTYISADGKIIRGGVVAAGISEIFPKGNMGLIAHEFGHLLGLPDLYDAGSSGYQSCGVGPYSLMGYGLYKGNPPGTLPSNLSPWEKIELDWAYPVLVTDSFCSAISSTSNSNQFIKIPAYGNENSGEYFLVEFRKKELFDGDFPSEGVIIWHIDEKVINSKIGRNAVNEDECYPGCGQTCGEIKDETGKFITCQKHYGVKVIIPLKYNEITKSFSDPYRFEKVNIFEDSPKCLISSPDDFFKEGEIFPDSFTSSFGYEGKPHNVLVATFWKTENSISIGATAKGSEISLRSPHISNFEIYDFVKPSEKYQAEINVQGTPPIKLKILEPKNAYFENKNQEIELKEFESNIKIFWESPPEEKLERIKIMAENCVERGIKEWSVRVQNPGTTINNYPQNSQGAGGVEGCSCSAGDQKNIISPLLLAVFIFIFSKMRKLSYHKS